MNSKIKLRRSILPLLIELDKWMSADIEAARKLSDQSLAHNEATDIGAERLLNKGIIIGIAWRINKASKGIKD